MLEDFTRQQELSLKPKIEFSWQEGRISEIRGRNPRRQVEEQQKKHPDSERSGI